MQIKVSSADIRSTCPAPAQRFLALSRLVKKKLPRSSLDSLVLPSPQGDLNSSSLLTGMGGNLREKKSEWSQPGNKHHNQSHAGLLSPSLPAFLIIKTQAMLEWISKKFWIVD